MEDLEKYKKERELLIEELRKMEQRKNEITLRLAEIQGVIKYLEEKKCQSQTT